MKKLSYWKSRKEWKRLTQGMNPDQVARLKQGISQGDEATIASITNIRTEQRAHLQEHGSDDNKFIPLIGNEIAWSDVLSMVFLISHFDRNGTVITNFEDVKAKSQNEPYGYLIVVSPTLNQPVSLPIIHKDDFILAASVYDNPYAMQVNEEQGREFLVTYQPQKTTKDGRSATPAHCLHYALVPRGTLKNYYVDDTRMSRPEPKLLFGEFIYSGEIRVQVMA